MSYTHAKIADIAKVLQARIDSEKNGQDILKAPEIRALYAEIPLLPQEQRAQFGKEVNALKRELEKAVAKHAHKAEEVTPIDVTAPFEANVAKAKRATVLPSYLGSQHPITQELEYITDILERMGFSAVESRQIDSDFNMFTSLNFPEDHPARDDYDSFMTQETDANGKQLIAPAHTSTMQNRVLKANNNALQNDEPIAVVIPGRCFRNEDLDATHEHTFYQLEGVYVSKEVTVGNLIATLKTFLETYFGEELQVRTQPFYFPFTEPSFEFAIKRGDRDWMELIGCGLIHPNVLKMAGINPDEYTGFAWGFGVDRLVMAKYGIEDIRHFESGKLEFLRQFK